MRADRSKKEITFNMSKNKQHAHNQTSEFIKNKCGNRMKKFYEMLLDIESTNWNQIFDDTILL